MGDAEDLGQVFRLVYRSRARIEPEDREAELAAIFDIARTRNAVAGITGALLVWRDAFVQLLEGDEAAVRGLYRAIRTDPRHDPVVLLDADTVPDRVFPRWSMARVGDDDGVDIPVHMDRGPSIVAPRPDTSRQDLMLDLMRDYAHGDVQPL